MEDDDAALRRHRARVGRRARDVAEPEVDVGVVRGDLEPEPFQQAGRGVDPHGAQVVGHPHELGALRDHELHGVAAVEPTAGMGSAR